VEWQRARLDLQEGFQRVVLPSIFNLRRRDIDTHSSGLFGKEPYQCSRAAAKIEMSGRPSEFLQNTFKLVMMPFALGARP
jgi:hypothetical protein